MPYCYEHAVAACKRNSKRVIQMYIAEHDSCAEVAGDQTFIAAQLKRKNENLQHARRHAP